MIRYQVKLLYLSQKKALQRCGERRAAPQSAIFFSFFTSPTTMDDISSLLWLCIAVSAAAVVVQVAMLERFLRWRHRLLAFTSSAVGHDYPYTVPSPRMPTRQEQSGSSTVTSLTDVGIENGTSTSVQQQQQGLLPIMVEQQQQQQHLRQQLPPPLEAAPLPAYAAEEPSPAPLSSVDSFVSELSQRMFGAGVRKPPTLRESTIVSATIEETEIEAPSDTAAEVRPILSPNVSKADGATIAPD